jgi:hypothetical protein
MWLIPACVMNDVYSVLLYNIMMRDFEQIFIQNFPFDGHLFFLSSTLVFIRKMMGKKKKNFEQKFSIEFTLVFIISFSNEQNSVHKRELRKWVNKVFLF